MFAKEISVDERNLSHFDANPTGFSRDRTKPSDRELPAKVDRAEAMENQVLKKEKKQLTAVRF